VAHPTFLTARNNPDDATPGQHDDDWHHDLALARTVEGHAISELSRPLCCFIATACTPLTAPRRR
jgi:hypothetical protein